MFSIGAVKKAARLVLQSFQRRVAAQNRHRSVKRAVAELRLAAQTSGDQAEAQPETIRSLWDGRQSLEKAKRIAIFAQYDDRGVSKVVRAYVREISEAGFAVVFVSSSPELADEDVEDLRPFVGKIVWRLNVGHDFGAWRDGLALLGNVERLDGLLLANDSVFGPFQKLDEVFARFDGRADVWALTESTEIARHLQSYFLYFCASALSSSAFQDFWSGFKIVHGRAWAIQNGELALSGHFRRNGLRLRALAGYENVRRSFRRRNRALHIREAAPHDSQPKRRSEIAFLLNDGHAVNPTHYFWRELVDEYGVPFLKRDLILANPELIADVDDARARVDKWLTSL